ncbi:MAG: SDR family oxidoreductase [Fuerstiella sp.]|nr:SDR family oxidoreductase [Fuerstiella sp.]
MRELRGKTVFLTGAASGIGRELALQLADAGCNLILVDCNQTGLDDVARLTAACGVKVHSYRCDLMDRTAVERTVNSAVRDAEPIDVLINNAGVAWYGSTHEMTQEQWDRLMSINLQAPIQVTRLLLPGLLQRPDAHIVNMCSIAGLVAGGRFTAYHTTKFGLVGFTEAIRSEYARAGIGVTAVCSGPVRTQLYQSAGGATGGSQIPQPPAIVCASAQRVAKLTITAIQRNRRMVLVTPLAHGLFQIKRFLPGLLDAVSGFSRSKRRRRQERLFREQQRLANLHDSSDSDVRADSENRNPVPLN